MKATDFVADFDSASAMLRATAAGLKRVDFASLGVEDNPLDLVAGLVNRLPAGLREQVYIWGGANEAVDAEKLDQLDEQAVARAMVAEYAERTYPVVMLGSSNGAAVHLGTALDAPWLPQTWFVPVRRDADPDVPLDDLAWSHEPAARLLEANPDLQLHHMHDPNQDRLMVRRLAYFRVKRRTLGAAYEQFLRERLQPGGTILLIECEVPWPVIRIGDRHVFQPGATGGVEPEEYLHGSERVAAYLERYGSEHRSWDFGEPNDVVPEAEWGFEPAMRDDVERFAAKHGFGVERMVFREPEDLSGPVADLYRWWYEQRGLRPIRLLAESFILMEPTWALRTGSAPLWLKFATEPSLHHLEGYLARSGPWEELMVMLFPHGTEGAGFADAHRWRAVIDRIGGRFLGVDEAAFPRDFAGLKNYHLAIAELGERFPLPDHPLKLDEVREFLDRRRASAGDEPSPIISAGDRT